jgi:hypothetical protein
MSIAIYPALVFTVVLLMTTAYFLFGGLPLLILDHGTSLDASFVRGFFNIYYKASFIAATGTAISFAGLGRFSFAFGAAALALVALVLRDKLTAAMDRLAAQIRVSEPFAVRRFKRVHSLALLVNLVQLIIVVWALIQFSLQV